MWHLIKFGFAFGIGLAFAKVVTEVVTYFIILSYIILVPEGTAGLGL